MKVELLYHTPLWVCAKAIRKCWASEDKSDSIFVEERYLKECPKCGGEVKQDYKYGGTDCEKCYTTYTNGEVVTGIKDKELIERVGNKNKHASTLEHLVYTFDIDGISRACLQEVARHRHASISVKSTRYTLKELKTADKRDFHNFLVYVDDDRVDAANHSRLVGLQERLIEGISNDQAKYLLPEAYKTSLVWTINARSLQNFLSLRTNKAALWEIRQLAYELYNRLPEEHKYLFFDSIYQEEKK